MPLTMSINLTQIKLRDLFDGYVNSDEDGVVGYHGRLDIRPKYQREFIYGDKEQIAVIETIKQGFPLNTMYWAVARDENGDKILDESGNETYELMDGQQRTISACEFLANHIVVNFQKFFNIQKSTPDIADKILDYELQVYICDGTVSDKLAWFKTINIAGKPLTEQELLNAQYIGEWLTKAKEYFSKSNCNAAELMVIRGKKAADYLSGSPIRQDYLSTILQWIADNQGLTPRSDKGDTYMANHQGDDTATELKNYYVSVMEWIGSKFKVYRKEMKGLPWGYWYNKVQRGECKGKIIEKNADEIENEIKRLIDDDDVGTVKGIYEYIVTGEEKYLSLRQFDDKIKRKVYEDQHHKCPYCDKVIDGHTYANGKTEYDYNEMEGDHIVPWSQGGKTEESNCQMLCKWHNGHKSDN
ncbi:DUF262 domain-containing protein [Eubacterium sp.]|uniref:HNH endonuclease family protein n=1 Tax=Eubacterium sp. TaxID=142586 RepID=UPI00258CD932|nr:DUF262 domain-containing protein [Eubacterium sp.]MCR5367525.1 DUF262 domain-containing protein [Eubacterium sp.]